MQLKSQCCLGLAISKIGLMSRRLCKSLSSPFTIIAALKEVHSGRVAPSEESLDTVELLSP